jgi:predicted nucleic acid-binding protein
MPALRLFLDANVLFLAGYSRTSPVHDLLEVARAGRCEHVASRYTVEEARRNLAVKGPDGAVDALEAALALVTTMAEARPPALELAAAADLSDRNDVPVLAAAIQCRADVLVTGDRRAFGRHFRATLAGVEVLVLPDALRRVLGLPLLGA